MEKNEKIYMRNDLKSKEGKSNKEEELYKELSNDLLSSRKDIFDILTKNRYLNNFYKKLNYKDKIAFVLLLIDFKV